MSVQALGSSMLSSIEVVIDRFYEQSAYLVTLCVSCRHEVHGGQGGAYPQAMAVPDDFGTLVCVSGWS